jgi:hypothetical protein
MYNCACFIHSGSGSGAHECSHPRHQRQQPALAAIWLALMLRPLQPVLLLLLPRSLAAVPRLAAPTPTPALHALQQASQPNGPLMAANLWSPRRRRPSRRGCLNHRAPGCRAAASCWCRLCLHLRHCCSHLARWWLQWPSAAAGLLVGCRAGCQPRRTAAATQGGRWACRALRQLH